jgi:hypothetical protein
MRDVDTEGGDTYDVLIQDNNFRIIRDPGSRIHQMIQHHCDNPNGTDETYCDPQRGWYYCWHGERTCSGCDAPVPSQVLGFITLIDWER